MKVFYVIYEDFGDSRASNWQIVNTANHLEREGLSVELIFPYEFSTDKYQIKNKTFFLFNKPINIFSKFNLLKFNFKLFLFLKSKTQEGDIIYFRHLLLLPGIFLISRLLPKIKVVYEVHREVNSAIGRFFEKKLVLKNTKVITISEKLKKIYQRSYSLSPKQIEVIHDAVDFQKFSVNLTKEEAKKQLNINFDRPVVMYLGTLWSVKGVELLFNAAVKMPEYNFYFIGKIHPEFHEIVKKYQGIPNIFILPAVVQTEVAVYQRAADLLVIPHLDNNLSQSPLKLFEYLASGTPILAAKLENLEEVLPLENLYFSPGSIEDLIDKIKIFFAESVKYQQQAKNNPMIAQKYSWQNRAQLIKEFIFR